MVSGVKLRTGSLKRTLIVSNTFTLVVPCSGLTSTTAGGCPGMLGGTELGSSTCTRRAAAPTLPLVSLTRTSREARLGSVPAVNVATKLFSPETCSGMLLPSNVRLALLGSMARSSTAVTVTVTGLPSPTVPPRTSGPLRATWTLGGALSARMAAAGSAKSSV